MWLWEDNHGTVHQVRLVPEDPHIKMFQEPGHEYVSIKVIDENRHHTAIVRLSTLIPVTH